jgi:branched-chain amino acid transport system ATP-binding protein
MTVLENVMALILARSVTPGWRGRKPPGWSGWLAEEADADPQSMTLARRKRLEVARALATRPRLCFGRGLAGLNPVEFKTRSAHPSIREGGVTIFIIEHIMAALMSL